MDPASPTKFPMSPGMPVFPVSPERVAGTKPPYGSPGVQSPTLPDLRTSPLRSHRRNDSDVSVHGLAAMFENLEVKDFKEAQAKYMQAMQRQRSKHASEIRQLEKDHALNMSRREMRIEELKTELKKVQESTKDAIAKEVWDRKHKEQREAIAKWEKAMQYCEEKRKQAESKVFELSQKNDALQLKYQQHKKKNVELHKDNLRTTGAIPTFQAKIQSLERHAKITESDLKFKTEEASKYKNQVYGLQVDLEGLEARLGEEIQTLKDRLRLVEGERDALKTSLKEEEVLRIAAEGQIPLPSTSADEHDEFGSPVRSPRKQRTPDRDEEDKENVAPKKAVVELRLLQQELVTEKRLRQRAQDQIEFMKMECQFQCCSCRIAENKGKSYVHDNSYATEIERIKSSVPGLTPPASIHGEDDHHMEDVDIKHESIDNERPVTPPSEERDTDSDHLPVNPPVNEAADSMMTYSPTTGTFRSVSSPVKGAAPAQAATPAKSARLGLSAITEMTTESSPWTPDAHSTVIPIEHVSPPQFRAPSQASTRKESKPADIVIHEDAVLDSDDDDEPQTPLHGPSGPATPGQYLTRTITTTTTIPLHFSPITPAAKPGIGPITPSTVAHAPADARTPVLGELSNVPIDREAALRAIAQRRGRARSMAAGHGTPRKQMMEGVKERRDISAPVSRVRR